MKPREARRAWRDDIRRRKVRRSHKPQAAAAPSAPGSLSTGSARRGLAARYFGALAQRRVLRVLTTPAAAGIVAVAVAAVFVALLVGTVLGAALATGHRSPGEWS